MNSLTSQHLAFLKGFLLDICLKTRADIKIHDDEMVLIFDSMTELSNTS